MIKILLLLIILSTNAMADVANTGLSQYDKSVIRYGLKIIEDTSLIYANPEDREMFEACMLVMTLNMIDRRQNFSAIEAAEIIAYDGGAHGKLCSEDIDKKLGFYRYIKKAVNQ